MRTLTLRCPRAGLAGLVAAALLLGGCASTKKFYDGPERAETDVVRLQSANSYVFSINGRRTDAGKERGWTTLVILPGTQRLIVQLDEELASRYGHVGVRHVFCAKPGRSYTVYPVTDIAARTWEPAVRDDASQADVDARACEAAAPAPAAPAPKAPLPSTSAAAAKVAPPTTPAPGAPAPAVAPPTAVPPAATPPAATATPAPAAAPGAFAAGGKARLRTSARIRASVDAPVVKGLDAGATVTLKVVLKKDTGPWWYVLGTGASGWVRESELEPAAP